MPNAVGPELDKAQGFTLVELMVALAVSMLAALGIYAVFNQSSAQQVRSSDTQETWQQARIAMAMIERDVRMAGYGYAASSACKVNAYNATRSPNNFSFAMQPILSNAPAPADAGTSDQITVLYSNSGYGGLPANKLRADMPNSSAELNISSTQGFTISDLILLQEAGKECTQLQVTAVQDSALKLQHNPGGSAPYNPPGGANIFPGGGYVAANGVNIYNLGSMVNRQYRISTSSQIAGQTDSAPNLVVTDLSTANTTSLARGIVSLQVLYGLDTNGDNEVDSYGRPDSATWFDTNANRIRTARIALLARSTAPDRTYTSPARIPVLPAISGNAAVNYNVPPADVHFRHQVFQTEIPLRNPILANQP